jgi:hypothetical protein
MVAFRGHGVRVFSHPPYMTHWQRITKNRGSIFPSVAFSVKTDVKITIECDFCKKEFLKEEREIRRKRVLGYTNCYCSKDCARKGMALTKTKYSEIDKNCAYCGKVFRSSNRPKGKKCCSKNCCALYIKSFETEETNEKRALKNKINWGNGVYDFLRKEDRKIVSKECDFCGESYFTRISKQKYCSHSCSSKGRKESEGLISYRGECRFKFCLADYPNEFDFSLIKQYGWYQPINRGDNLNGISRDHIVSVKYGFENDIDPNIISHPANCQLLKHCENSSKNSKCSLTLDELLKNIQEWDKKYI